MSKVVIKELEKWMVTAYVTEKEKSQRHFIWAFIGIIVKDRGILKADRKKNKLVTTLFIVELLFMIRIYSMLFLEFDMVVISVPNFCSLKLY